MKDRLAHLKTCLWGAMYAATSGCMSGIATYWQNVSVYAEVDWENVRFAAIGGAVFGIMGYIQKERKVDEALYTMPPDGGHRAFMKSAVASVEAEHDAKVEKAEKAADKAVEKAEADKGVGG